MSIPTRVKSGVIEIQDSILTPAGFQQISSLSSATALTPNGATMALIQAVAQNVRWRDDGEDPTAAIGMRMLTGGEFWYTGDLTAIKFIEEAVSAELNISYYTY